MECHRDVSLLGWAHAVLFSGRWWWVAAARKGRFSWDNFFVGTNMGDRDGFGSEDWGTRGDTRKGRFSWDNFFVGTNMGGRDGFGSEDWDTQGDKRALECFSLLRASGGIEK